MSVPAGAGAGPVRQALEDVLDPELGMSVVDLGLIYDIEVTGSTARITMTLTAQGCPFHEAMVDGVRAAALAVPGIEKANVEVVFDPPWTPERIRRACRP